MQGHIESNKCINRRFKNVFFFCFQKRQELMLQRQRIEADSVIEEVEEYSPQN